MHPQILSFQKPDIWKYKRKIGVGFAKIYLGFIFLRKSVEILYLSKFRFCTKMHENLSARKFLQIKYKKITFQNFLRFCSGGRVYPPNCSNLAIFRLVVLWIGLNIYSNLTIFGSMSNYQILKPIDILYKHIISRAHYIRLPRRG